MKQHGSSAAILSLALTMTLLFASCQTADSMESGKGQEVSEIMTGVTTAMTADEVIPRETTPNESMHTGTDTSTNKNTQTVSKSPATTRAPQSTSRPPIATTDKPSTTTSKSDTPAFVATKTLDSIRIRDPYIVVSREEGVYYMFGTTYNSFSSDGGGFMYYKSYDQKLWAGPYDAFNAAESGLRNRYTKYWAPEIHQYQGEYYMFATFGSDTTRHSVILKSISGKIGGPYAIHFDNITPPEWSALDATLYVENGEPWMVYCREWVGIESKNGEMYAQRLSKDLKSMVGERRYLFKGSDAPGQTTSSLYVTDGPFLYKGPNGVLYLLWSSGIKGKGYTTIAARSSNGRMDGNWTQDTTLLYTQDGGHPMVYTDLAGKTCLALHTPNSNSEHAEIFALSIDKDGFLELNQ